MKQSILGLSSLLSGLAAPIGVFTRVIPLILFGFASALEGCSGNADSSSAEGVEPSPGQTLEPSSEATSFLDDLQKTMGKLPFERTGPVSLSLSGGTLVPKLSERATISARLPAKSAAQFTLRDTKSRMQIAVRLRGARDIAGQNAGRAVVYRNGHEHGDVILRPSDAGIEDYLLVRSEKVAAVGYDVDLSPEVKGVRLVENTLELLDASGDPRLRAAPPYLVDAQGSVHGARLAISGCSVDTNPAAPWGRAVTPAGASTCRVTVTWDNAGLRYPVLVDPSWGPTGNMVTPRARFSLCGPSSNFFTGYFLAAGGNNPYYPVQMPSTSIKTAELYNPLTQTWSPTASMSTPRAAYVSATFSQTAMTFDDKCLVAGGYAQSPSTFADLKTAEVYSFGSGTWAAAPSMSAIRRFAATASTDTGKVLVFGGFSVSGTQKTAEIYNFSTNTWTNAASATTARSGHTLTRLNPGIGLSDVIAVGGNNSSGGVVGSCERYSATLNAWSGCGSLPTPVTNHTATLCTGCAAPRDGKVIVTGGWFSGYLRNIQRFDPANNSWTADGLLPAPARADHQAILRMAFGDSARILVMGGTAEPTFTTIKAASTWPAGGIAFSGSMANERALFGLGQLSNGQIIVAGGYRSQSSSVIGGTELFTP